MEWTALNDSLHQLHTHREILKGQGHYLSRLTGVMIAKKVLRKFNAHIYTRGMEKLVDHPGKRVLLVSNHRSYLDPLIIGHLTALYGKKQPRPIGLDFVAATPLAPLFRKCGAIFIKEKFDNLEYREKMNSILREAADAGDYMEFFLEGQRSISGKQMDPKRGLLTAFMDKPCVIYPLNLSFERLIEDREFISKSRGWNLGATVKSLMIPSKGMGVVRLSVGDPIYTDPKDIPREIAMKVTSEILKQNTIYATDIIAAVLLDRQEAIQIDTLKDDVLWLQNVIIDRKINVVKTNVDDALKLLKHAIKVKKNMVSIRDKTLLIYYRNRMIYTISDMIATPTILRKEALWTPDHYPRLKDAKRLKEIAKRALEPTVFLYKYLMEQIQQGETSMKTLRRSIEDNPHSCYETVTNLVTVLVEDKVVTRDGDIITLLENK